MLSAHSKLQTIIIMRHGIMLRDRYDDCSLIVQKHVKALFEISIIYKENHVALRRMIDSVLKHLRTLKALQRPTDHWDDLIVHIVTSRLDQKTSRAWEATLKKRDLPTTKQLLDFLTQYYRALEASDRTQRAVACQAKASQGRATSSNIASISVACAYCKNQEHAIYNCKSFLQLDV